MNDHNPVRVGDDERAAAAERLSAAAAAGRLSIPELEARLEAANGAVYAHELAALEHDLPVRRERPRHTAPPQLLFFAPVLALAIALSVAVGHPVFLPVLAFLFIARFARRSWA